MPFPQLRPLGTIAATLFTTLGCSSIVCQPPPPLPKNTDLDLSNLQKDINGLPFEPLWNYQVRVPGHLPEPYCSCNSFDPGGSADNCTDSQEHTCSLGPTEPARVAACRELGFAKGFSGHVNWAVATYRGGAYWKGHSFDGDHDFALAIQDWNGIPNSNGLTQRNMGGDKGGHMWFELEGHSTINSINDSPTTAGPWTDLENLSEDIDTCVSSECRHWYEHAAQQIVSNADAVVTGLLNLDSEHQGHAELHPVFAIAIRFASGNCEQWAIMIRNWGSEGFCSSGSIGLTGDEQTQVLKVFIPTHLPPSSFGGRFYPLPSGDAPNMAVNYSVSPDQKGIVVAATLPNYAEVDTPDHVSPAGLYGYLYQTSSGCSVQSKGTKTVTESRNFSLRAGVQGKEDRVVRKALKNQLPGAALDLFSKRAPTAPPPLLTVTNRPDATSVVGSSTSVRRLQPIYSPVDFLAKRICRARSASGKDSAGCDLLAVPEAGSCLATRR